MKILQITRPYKSISKEEKKQYVAGIIHSFIIIHSSTKYYVNFQYISGSLPGAENFTVNKANRIQPFQSLQSSGEDRC